MNKATDSGSSLTEQDVINFVANAKYDQFRPQRITLVAPNMKIAKQWSTQYPGCEILISADNLPNSLNQKRRSYE